MQNNVVGKWVVGIAVSVWASATMAAPISWQAAQNSQGLTDVVTVGSLVEARNATTGSAGTTTVNGVEFANVSNLLGDTFSGALGGSSSGDAGYNGLLDTFNWGGGTSTSIQLAGGLLTSGWNYTLQVWFTDLRSCCSSRDMTFGGDGATTTTVNASGAGLGQFAVGSFTADSSSQTLTLATNGFANAHISGYQVRAVPSTAVPVPGTLLLFGLGLLGLGLMASRRIRVVTA